MKLLRFRGFGDDTFTEETTGIDHDNGGSGRPIEFRVTSPTHPEEITVVGHYAPTKPSPGVWMIGIRQHEEDTLTGAAFWPLKWDSLGYTMILEIEAPDDAQVELVGKDEG